MTIDLPSREEVAMQDLGFRSWLDQTVKPIILAYASGRLLDREAGIDCEAVASVPGFDDGEYAITVRSSVPLETLTMHGRLVLVPISAAIGDTKDVATGHS